MVLLRDIHFGSGGFQVYLMKRRGRVEVGRQTFVASRCKDFEELPLNGRGLTKVGRN